MIYDKPFSFSPSFKFLFFLSFFVGRGLFISFHCEVLHLLPTFYNFVLFVLFL